MYNSPINVAYTEMLDNLREKCDDAIYRAVLYAGVEVDRDELIKALAYDRNQYSAGYVAGYAAGYAQARKDFLNWCTKQKPPKEDETDEN